MSRLNSKIYYTNFLKIINISPFQIILLLDRIFITMSFMKYASMLELIRFICLLFTWDYVYWLFRSSKEQTVFEKFNLKSLQSIPIKIFSSLHKYNLFENRFCWKFITRCLLVYLNLLYENLFKSILKWVKNGVQFK